MKRAGSAALRGAQAAMLTIGTLLVSPMVGFAAESPLLQLETKIPLGEVSGRIDHMAVDIKRQRLFVAELGNNTLGVVDLAGGKLLRTLTGLKEPQGVGYEPSGDMIYVANARDGSVHLFQASDFAPAGTIELGKDADNIRIDGAGRRVIVGYGEGALAVIDAATRRKIGDVRLKAHPEGFQLDSEAQRIFVNLPDDRGIAVVDSAAGKKIAAWPQAGRTGNYPMALAHARQHVLAVFRSPAVLAAFAMADGAAAAKIQTCGDSDDVFVDAKRQRAYVSCGEGFLDVFDLQATPMTRVARVPTAAGGRTSLFIPELDRLVIAVPARGAQVAAIWVFRPLP
jgi:DNA-binding beta-propeller fold protein YncE